MEDMINDMAVGPGGEVVVTGSFINDIDFGMGPQLGDLDSRNGYIATFGDDCVPAWSRHIISPEETRGVGLAIDADQRVLAAGYFNANVDFGGVALIANGMPDAYLAAYRLDNGGPLWVRQSGDDAAQAGVDVALDAAGNLIFIGYFDGQIDLGAQVPLVANGTDPFVAKYAPSTDEGPGELLWNQLFTGPSTQFLLSVAPDALGNMVIAGVMVDRLSVGSTVLDHAGGTDVWVAKLRP
jgi:hypothetical protein